MKGRLHSERLRRLTSDIFAELAQARREVEASGRQVIDLGVGSPAFPPSLVLRQALSQYVLAPESFGYPLEGLPSFQREVSRWYQFRFGVDLDPGKEVLVLMGSQDGLAHLAQALLNPGDRALIPNPHYPIYATSILLAGGEIDYLPLRAERGFLPDLAAVPERIARQAKLMLLNYPSNPLAAVADLDFYAEVVTFAKRYDILVAHDAAYSELSFDGLVPPSFLQVPGAKDVGVEFHSLSKSFNLAGCRIGMLVGNRNVVAALAKLKANIDYGTFLPIQRVAELALRLDREGKGEKVAPLYQSRRDVLLHGLSLAGWDIPKPKATMFAWAPVPQGWSSRGFARRLLEEAGVVVTPGDAFGSMGEGYVRIAYVHDEETLRLAAERIKANRFWQA